jgi:hypothetical protein
MKMLTPADEPTTSEILTQALTMLVLWGPVLTRALAISFRDSTSLANLTQDLALALVEAQEAEQPEYQAPNPDPALELMATLADVDAIFPVGGHDDD